MADKEIKPEDKKEQNSPQSIIDKYLSIRDKYHRIGYQEMKDLGISKDSLKHHFGSLVRLDVEARKLYPQQFSDVSIKDFTAPEKKAELEDAIKKFKRFVITTAVKNCDVHAKMLESLRYYCKLNDAVLLILTVSDPAHNRSGMNISKEEEEEELGYIDSALVNDHIIVEDTALNSNFFISNIKLSAKQIDPVTGLGRIGQKEGSFVYGSPKQRLKLESTSNNKMPHAVMSTGAITHPNYLSSNYMSARTAYLAEHDHIMGAIVVEIEDKKFYHYRQIQVDEDGRFVDLGVMYSGEEHRSYLPEALVLGDWHAGDTDPVVRKVAKEVMTEFKPKHLVLHDAFNGKSINHHEQYNEIQKALKAERGQANLKQEIAVLAKDLDELAPFVDQIVLVKSNHDEWLNQYLDKCDFSKQPINRRISMKLALKVMDNLDPLKSGVEMLGLKYASKVRWLRRDEDFKIAGIQLGAHGDRGPNGSRGTIRNLELAYGQCVIGHSHTPGIIRGSWQVGTSTYLKLSYNKGPSSWLQTMCLVYPNGMRQLLNVVEGRWRLGE